MIFDVIQFEKLHTSTAAAEYNSHSSRKIESAAVLCAVVLVSNTFAFLIEESKLLESCNWPKSCSGSRTW